VRVLAVFFMAFVFLFGCKEPVESSIPEDSLGFLIGLKSPSQRVHKVIACAAGGQNDIFPDPNFPISIFYYPEGEVKNISYWESSVPIDNLWPSTLLEQRYSSYAKVELQRQPVFNGKLERFLRGPANEPKSGIVSYERNDTLFFSQPINLKATSKPTEFNSDLLNIDTSNSLAPIFNWEDGIIDENVIYFQVVSDFNGNIISGTYTEELNFQFYNLDNVVLNIHDVEPTPTLIQGEDYTFTLMAVNEDNWVNLIIEKTFTAQ